MHVSVAEAKNRLPELIRAVVAGEAITICRRGVPVVDIVPTKATTEEEPRFGTLKSRVVVHDPEWWKPMAEAEIDALLDESR